MHEPSDIPLYRRQTRAERRNHVLDGSKEALWKMKRVRYHLNNGCNQYHAAGASRSRYADCRYLYCGPKSLICLRADSAAGAHSGDSNLLVVILAVVAAVLLVTVILVVVCYCFKLNKRSDPEGL